VDGKIVGRGNIRHELNDFLRQFGGHIGYGVLPQYRRRGYATEILRQAIPLAHKLGIKPILVTCDDNNVGSIKTIENCGGVLENAVPQGENKPLKRRYWI
jgi:predicted acetyltransferase